MSGHYFNPVTKQIETIVNEEANDKANNLKCLLRLNDYDQQLVSEEINDLRMKQRLQESAFELSLLPLKQKSQQLEHECLKLQQELNSLSQASGWARSKVIELKKREFVENLAK